MPTRSRDFRSLSVLVRFSLFSPGSMLMVNDSPAGRDYGRSRRNHQRDWTVVHS